MLNFSEINSNITEKFNNTANEEENSHHQGIQLGLSIILCLIVSSIFLKSLTKIIVNEIKNSVV